jgi:hypothetical protein
VAHINVLQGGLIFLLLFFDSIDELWVIGVKEVDNEIKHTNAV